jgi:adenosylmethionine-8-amino-7-oxononanoate aminotransferase
MVLAIELTRDGNRDTPLEPSLRAGLRAYRMALTRGVVLRPLGDILYWMPPYCIDDDQLELLADTTHAAILEATACA